MYRRLSLLLHIKEKKAAAARAEQFAAERAGFFCVRIEPVNRIRRIFALTPRFNCQLVSSMRPNSFRSLSL